MKIWYCEDDGVVSVEVTRRFVAKITAGSGKALLRTFPHGGQEPQLVGEFVENPCGNTVFCQKELKITPAVEEVLAWIREFC